MARAPKIKNIPIVSKIILAITLLSGLSLVAGSHAHTVPAMTVAYSTKSAPLTAPGTVGVSSVTKPASTPSPDWAAAASAAAAKNALTSKSSTNSTAANAAAAAASSQTAAASPARSASLYVNTSSNVAVQARAWATTHPGNASVMNRLANTPMATWFGGWSGDIQTATANYVSAASNAGQQPVLVAYNIPQRDCGNYSSGGAANAGAYKTWITNFAAGIGRRSAIVIIEPDALAELDCNGIDQPTRLELLNYAVSTLRAQTKASIYLDAGKPNWQSAATMVDRLNNGGVANATGFSLNVSNFESTASNTSYGTSISAGLGGKHFVIDTSRNGNGPPPSSPESYCNPDGRSFGNAPTFQTGNSIVDAYLWIKNPGESDGTCGAPQQGTAAPTAGAWWPQYVLMLASNSRWN